MVNLHTDPRDDETISIRLIPVIVRVAGTARRHYFSRLRKKPFRSLLSLSVISPRGGELNTSGAEGGAS